METKHIEAQLVYINQLSFDRFRIPVYQRPYVWSCECALQLLGDIRESLDTDRQEYRIGSLILHELDNGELDIIDGQQRITTLLLILKALEHTGIDSGRMVFMHEESFAHIRENYHAITTWFQQNGRNGFEEYLWNRCRFTVITVAAPYISEAFQMFDSQNGRGKELKTYNLLKAYHLRAMDTDEEAKKCCDRRWEAAANSETGDLLLRVIDEHLYRSRLWARDIEARHFSNRHLPEFKGIPDKKFQYPYQNLLHLRQLAEKVLSPKDLANKKFIGKAGLCDAQNLFCSIDGPILNGKPFFDYVNTYVELYRRLFTDEAKKTSETKEFYDFYRTFCKYKKSERSGDTYLRNLYKSLVLFTVDRFGTDGLMEQDLHKRLYALVYARRLLQYQVKYAGTARFPVEKKLFITIRNAYTVAQIVHSLPLIEIDENAVKTNVEPVKKIIQELDLWKQA